MRLGEDRNVEAEPQTGTFAKTVLPTLRLGFLLASPSLLPALRKAKLGTDWHTAGPMQEALAQFIGEGAFAKHIRRMRRFYSEPHQMIVSTLDSRFGGCLVRIPSMVGIHVTALFRPEVPRPDQEVVEMARRRGVELSPAVSVFAVTGRPRSGLMLGYGAIPTERIAEGLRRLRGCVTAG